MLVELFAITETEWKSERAIASLVAATSGSGINALVGIIVPTIAEKKRFSGCFKLHEAMLI